MCYKLLRLYDGIYKLVYYAEDGSYSLTLKKLESADDAQEYNRFPPSEIVNRLIGGKSV